MTPTTLLPCWVALMCECRAGYLARAVVSPAGIFDRSADPGASHSQVFPS